MSSIFKPQVSHSRKPRNAFDLGNRSLFTTRCGMLLPVFTREMNPGEKFTVSPSVFCRTQPLNTAAFARVKQNLDFFFVPLRVLWHNFGNVFSGTEYVSRTFDDYGNPNLQMPYLQSGWYMSLLEATSEKDMFGYPLQDGAMRLLDMLNYGRTKYSDGDNIINGYSVSLWRLLAYQKIYQDFYRLPLYERYDASTCNVDNTSGAIPNPDFLDMMQIRYCNWKKDYFTNNRPSFAGADFISNYVTPSVVNPSSAAVSSSQSTSVINNQAVLKSGTYVNTKGSFPFNSANQLRSLFALDKLAKLMERAHDGSYSSQVEARFGVRPRVDGDTSFFIKAFDAPISIGEVVSTADTATSSELGENLGKIAGKGYADMSGSFDYESSEHGILMGILSFVPEADYASNGLSRFNTMLSSADFYQPEFDELGYQPTFGYELEVSPNLVSANSVLGYNPRYAHYKTNVDEVHGGFLYGSLSSWVACRKPQAVQSTYKDGLTTQFLKVNPNVLDPIFVVEAKDLSPDYDTFLCSMDVRVTALRGMSTYGTPNI